MLFITIWPEPLCISTIWRGFCPFSNHPLNLMTGHHRPRVLVNPHLTEVSIRLYPYLWPLIHRPCFPMVDFHHVSLPILNNISDPLQPTPLLVRDLFRQTIHPHPPLHVAHPYLTLSLSIRNLLLIHIQNPDLYLTFHGLRPEPPSRCLFDPNNAAE